MKPKKAANVPLSWPRHAVVVRAPPTPSAGPVELNYQGQAYSLTVGQIGPRSYRVDGDSGELVVEVERLGEFESRLTLGDHRYHIVTVAGPTGFLVEVDGISHRISQDEAGLVRAGSPAVVVAMPVAVGDQVEAGATLVVLESMKMETALRAPAAGRVREIFATVNNQVDAGAALLRFDQVGENATAEAEPRVQFRTQPRNEDANPRTEALARLDELRALIIGYDVSADRARILLAEYDDLRGQPAARRPGTRRGRTRTAGHLRRHLRDFP